MSHLGVFWIVTSILQFWMYPIRICRHQHWLHRLIIVSNVVFVWVLHTQLQIHWWEYVSVLGVPSTFIMSVYDDGWMGRCKLSTVHHIQWSTWLNYIDWMPNQWDVNYVWDSIHPLLLWVAPHSNCTVWGTYNWHNIWFWRISMAL